MLSDEQFTHALLQQRPAVRQLCVQMTKGEETADDLLQATLLEAWEHRQTLRDPQCLPQWLFAIARNICNMWLRRKILQQERTQLYTLSSALPMMQDFQSSHPVEQEVEQRELFRLLDRALTNLPAETRTLLTEHYIEKLPTSESAQRQGILLRTAQKRLERGKSAFRHLLQTDFHAELAPYLSTAQQSSWETTRLCCPRCGQHYLQARFSGETVQFDCPHCLSKQGTYITAFLTPGIKGYKKLLFSMMTTVEQRYRSSLTAHSLACPRCGRRIPLVRKNAAIFLQCAHCQTINQNTLDFFALALPQGRQFWQSKRSISLLPPTEVNFAGQSALRVSYQARQDTGRYEVFFARNTFEILSIQEP